MNEQSTPLMRQYAAVKKEHPNALVFFRLGDFYEMFFEDAIVGARELQITLTSRNKEKGEKIPMCGIPYHAAEGYIAKLIRKGFKVALCEQMEDPRQTKTLVRREVTRVITPGTAAEIAAPAEESNFLAAVTESGGAVGFAALELSTGEFRATEFRGEDAARRVMEEMQQLRPKEVLFASSMPLFAAAGRTSLLNPAAVAGETNATHWERPAWAETPLDDWIFAQDHAVPLLENHFGVLSLEGFGLAGRPAAAAAAGAILHYVRTTQRGTLHHVDRIGFFERQDCLVLDAVTVRNLELVEPLFGGEDGGITLFRSLDATATPMGKRLFRAWMLRPALDSGEIQARLDAVDAWVRETVAREDLRRPLQNVLDLERLLSRVTLETANPRDLLSMATSLAQLPVVRGALAKLDAPRIQSLHTAIDDLSDLRRKIEETLADEPPLTLADGNVIRKGVDAQLDELRDLRHNSRQYIAQIEQRERDRTKIGSLKVKFNSIFGYYLEVSKPNLHLVPADYERKQTLVNAERFTTPELKEYESKVLDAQERIVEIERRLFHDLRTAIAAEAKRIRQTTRALAETDVLSSFAHVAAMRGYTRPQFDDSGDLEVRQGRHPVIEGHTAIGERFVPNDLFLNRATHAILVLTGPNMGGKSTYLRQTALLVILAQMGSFVPAQSMRLSLIDRIFTRIGASDNLARGRSTFMVEMTETAAILHTASPRSLILLDEVGRGTSTYDGLAIAWAAVEYLHRRTRAKTLFATHYFELTELAETLSGVKNFHVAVKETGGDVVFLRKVEPGAADQSYGIEVAKLAGLPTEVITRAREVLAEHENAERTATGRLGSGDVPPLPRQLTIFTPLSHEVLDRLRDVDLNRLTPLEAMNLLAELKNRSTDVISMPGNLGDNFVIGFEGTAMTPALGKLLTRIQPAGVILFRRNIESAEQTWGLLRDCQRHITTPLFTCVDMEGGTVDRLRDVFGPSPSAASVFETADRGLFRMHGKIIGAICRALGFNVDFAPTLDLALPPSLPVMGTRVVSANPHEVAAYARAFLHGLSDSRVLGCAKHFPGLGEVPLDTHKDLPIVNKSMRRLLAEDIEPYRTLRRDLPFVMVCHAIYATATRDQVPASLSKKWMTDVLRKKLGHTGLTITDDMEMGALQEAAPMEQAAVQALRAGADLLLICHSEEQINRAYDALAKERDRDRRFAGRLRESAGQVARQKRKFARILTAKSLPRPTQTKVERLSRNAVGIERTNPPRSLSARGTTMIVAGVMSGTSADGINVALVRIAEAPANARNAPGVSFRLLGHAEFPYSKAVRREVLRLMNSSAARVADLARLNFFLGELYAEAVRAAQKKFHVAADLVGCHGQTLYHQGVPEAYLGRKLAVTWQTGEGAVVSQRLGIPVVSDFRVADMSAGGKGAPLVPFLDFMLFRHASTGRIAQNIGGIANLTATPAGSSQKNVIAFDTGPGNMVIDALAENLLYKPYDRDGRTAAMGTVLEGVLTKFLKARFFHAKPPKTAGREEFGREFAAQFARACGRASRQDILATATALTSSSIANAIQQFVPLKKGCYQEIIVSGGGLKNATLMAMLANAVSPLGLQVRASDELGLPSDAKEAAAFALLAYETWHRRPSNVPSATGAKKPAILGKISYA